MLAAPDLVSGYCIFNRKTSALLHIEDEALNAALCKRMQEQGCEILDGISPLTVNVKPKE